MAHIRFPASPIPITIAEILITAGFMSPNTSMVNGIIAISAAIKKTILSRWIFFVATIPSPKLLLLPFLLCLKHEPFRRRKRYPQEQLDRPGQQFASIFDITLFGIGEKGAASPGPRRRRLLRLGANRTNNPNPSPNGNKFGLYWFGAKDGT